MGQLLLLHDFSLIPSLEMLLFPLIGTSLQKLVLLAMNIYCGGLIIQKKIRHQANRNQKNNVPITFEMLAEEGMYSYA